ncbi:MAG: hypothetical protein WBC05_01720 [Sedimentisphaerales bacterium]
MRSEKTFQYNSGSSIEYPVELQGENASSPLGMKNPNIFTLSAVEG